MLIHNRRRRQLTSDPRTERRHFSSMYIVGVSSAALSQHQTGKFRSGDVEIFYRLFGRAGRTPVVILHGLSYFSYDWIDLAAELAIDRQIVAMDMHGFGDSGWAKDYSVP